MPRTHLRSLLFSFRKGSEATFIWHMTERRGSIERTAAEYGGVPGEDAGALGELQGAAALIPFHRSGLWSPFGPRLQLPFITPIMLLATPAASTCGIPGIWAWMVL